MQLITFTSVILIEYDISNIILKLEEIVIKRENRKKKVELEYKRG